MTLLSESEEMFGKKIIDFLFYDSFHKQRNTYPNSPKSLF